MRFQYLHRRYLELIDSPEIVRLRNCLFRRTRKVVDRRMRCARKDQHFVFVDVSVVVKNDAGTGIQRVVTAVSEGLRTANWQRKVIFVGASKKDGYGALVGGTLIAEWPICPGEGDIFFGLDFALDSVVRHRKQLANMRSEGCRLIFFVHDLLPVTNPEWFTDRNVIRFRQWISVIGRLAEGFFCNSAVTEASLRYYLRVRGRPDCDYWTHVLPLGHEVTAPRFSARVMSEHARRCIDRLNGVRFILVVGTIEPRKGHEDILDAFELLWRKRRDVRLVLVGRPGWNTKALQARLRSHPLLENMLYWFDDLNDDGLERLYCHCEGVVSPSLSEGFGLPVAEALARKRPVLARDIPAYRERSHPALSYFNAECSSIALAERLDEWLAGLSRLSVDWGRVPTWTETCAQITGRLTSLDENDWART